MPFIITGLVTGAVYGLAGVGLVLTYKTSGIFNFAHGALATVAAYVFYALHVEHELSWPWPRRSRSSRSLRPVSLADRVPGPRDRARRAGDAGRRDGRRAADDPGRDAFSSTAPRRRARCRRSSATGETQHRRHDRPVGGHRDVRDRASRDGGALRLLPHRRARASAMRAVVDDPELLDLAGTSPTRVRRHGVDDRRRASRRCRRAVRAAAAARPGAADAAGRAGVRRGRARRVHEPAADVRRRAG